MSNEKALRKVKKFIRDDGKLLVEVLLNNVRPIHPHRELPVNFLDGIIVERLLVAWLHSEIDFM